MDGTSPGLEQFFAKVIAAHPSSDTFLVLRVDHVGLLCVEPSEPPPPPPAPSDDVRDISGNAAAIQRQAMVPPAAGEVGGRPPSGRAAVVEFYVLRSRFLRLRKKTHRERLHLHRCPTWQSPGRPGCRRATSP